MEKYKGYKNRLEMFLASDKGKRVLNFLYSWGASIVILGALFKLLHLPYANQILCVAMVTESIVFFISAFEKPNKEYQWEDVFPVLHSRNPMDRPNFGKTEEEEEREGTTQVQPMDKNPAPAFQTTELTEATKKYLEQMEQLNLDLGRMREMYDGSVTNSIVFRSETEKMTRQLAELNQVYGRLLQAMTVNMGYPQQGYQQPYNPQQPPYTNNPVK